MQLARTVNRYLRCATYNYCLFPAHRVASHPHSNASPPPILDTRDPFSPFSASLPPRTRCYGPMSQKAEKLEISIANDARARPPATTCYRYLLAGLYVSSAAHANEFNRVAPNFPRDKAPAAPHSRGEHLAITKITASLRSL